MRNANEHYRFVNVYFISLYHYIIGIIRVVSMMCVKHTKTHLVVIF